MRFYVSDLDGTLLDPQAQLSSVTRAHLTELLAEGLAFTVASARHVVSIARILDGLPISLPVVSSNGAYISDLRTGRHELVNAMEPSLGQAIFALVRRHGLMPFVATHGAKGDQLFWQEVQNEGQQRFVTERQRNADPRLRHAARIQDELDDPLVTMLVVARMEPLAALQAEIHALCGDRVTTHLAEDLYMPGWPWLNIHDRRASKDQAIKTLAERYALHERELVVFGDQVNDLSMLKAAHHAVAVSNASDDVKLAAHRVIGPHHEDAVVHFIREDWATRIKP
ncbi:HAD family hydrolase [Roseateles chitosanitabidus]|jgi:Cof subfamily protein (haloacid dehalogenase superfamily)|uniref:HAD family hydrolase n=1 Tax=Roseateles chitosanitabidus TaxID=65048 RepID=UPI0008309B85|nr:HAD family hydrolase [Roseateles chitosanitabidus]